MFDNIIDVDSAVEKEVAFARMLDIGIIAGTQEYPRQQNPTDVANRLLIFTGTATFTIGKETKLNNPVIRVRLHFKVRPTVKYVGSATVAALASLHTEDDDVSVFAADAGEAVVGPTGGRQIPDHGLPQDELYVLLDAGIMGDQAILSRIAYQANVLILDTRPDLSSILVREAGSGGQFASEAIVGDGKQWEYLLTLTGPADPQDPITIKLESEDEQTARIDNSQRFNQIPPLQFSLSRTMQTAASNPGLAPKIVTITAIGRRVSKTARLNVQRGVG